MHTLSVICPSSGCRRKVQVRTHAFRSNYDAPDSTFHSTSDLSTLKVSFLEGPWSNLLYIVFGRSSVTRASLFGLSLKLCVLKLTGVLHHLCVIPDSNSSTSAALEESWLYSQESYVLCHCQHILHSQGCSAVAVVGPLVHLPNPCNTFFCP